MQYDPLIEILNVAEKSVQHPAKLARAAKSPDRAETGPESQQGIAEADGHAAARIARKLISPDCNQFGFVDLPPLTT